MDFCQECFNDFEDFDRCDSTMIRRALALPEGTLVPLGSVAQEQVNARRRRLHHAALAQCEPIEITTIPGIEAGTIAFRVRRFKS